MNRIFIGTLLASFWLAGPSFAVTGPPALSLGGQLYNPSGGPVEQASVAFKVQIYDAAGTCVLYSETHLAQDLRTNAGRFNLIVGAGSSVVNNVGTPGVLDAKVFANAGATAVANCATPVTLNPGDARQIRISYDLGSGYVALTPDVPVVSSAYAMIADTLQGKAADEFIQVADNGSSALTQTNAAYAFSATNWPRLKALLDGSSAQYLPTTPTLPLDFNNQRVTNVADPVAAQDLVTKHYADTTFAGRPVDVSTVGPMTGGGRVMAWDATANKWVASVLSTTPTGVAGGDLTGTYPNPTVKDDAITARKIASAGGGINRLLITDATTGATVGYGVCALNQVYAWTASGWACASVASLSPVTSVAGKTGAVTLNPNDITGLGTAALYDYGTGAGQIPRLDGAARMPAVDGSQLLNVNATQLQSRFVATTAPVTGQVLGWNGSAWTPVSTAVGSVTNVATANGLLGGPITSSGTISVDTGSTANKILQLNASAQIPAVDGALLFNVNASKIATRVVASTAPTSGQVLGWNVTTTQWEPMSAATGSVQNVASGPGLLGGPITSSGTLSVDVGTAANKILQLNASAQIPAVDASLLFNVNASKLATRTVATTAPTTGQVLGWNVTSTQWEPVSAATGSVQNVSSGVGLLGGPITSNGTLSVDVGTAANKILQLNASAQIPAVDGSLVTGVNAIKLQTRAVAATAPTAGQVLGWNAATSQWEPTLATAGSVTNIQTANGILGGPITSTGTISVDTGTIANKILQLNASAQIPAVDASLLFNVNASKLATRTVATTAPTSGQVLGWNGTTTQWEPVSAATGSVQNVASGVGLLGGPITSNGTLSVDVGTAANKILQLNASAQIPAVDASLLFNVNASKIATRVVASTAPTSGQVLGWNVTTTQWEPVSAATGSVQNVSSGVGLLGGPITSNGTLSVDVGTAANKILQLNASAQIPAVDGSLLSGVNAVKLQTRAVATTAPTAGQVLAWNATISQWEPTLATAGSVTNVQTANGILGGPITSTGTISVDTGTIANKILQLNASAQIPAVDASLLFNVNASKIATRTVATTAPSSGQVLGWNVTTTQWEPVSAATGSVQNVASGTGLLGGPITSNGTLSVDVGTAANKILQLNASAQIPAVDGSLVTGVNAVKLQTRAVAATAPTAGQVLGWNASTSQWEPTLASSGSVTNIQTANGILGGPITSSGTISVDTGTIANKILQLNASAQIPAVDASLLFNVNASKLATRTVATTAPTSGQVLGWNVTTTQWEPVSAATGSVQNVATGLGLLGGPITSTGTLSVDVGSAAGKIVRENANAQIAQLAGSVYTPAFSFAGDEDTGMYASANNELSFATSGTSALTIYSDSAIAVSSNFTMFQHFDQDLSFSMSNPRPGRNASVTLGSQGLFNNININGTTAGTTTAWSLGTFGTRSFELKTNGINSPFSVAENAPHGALYVANGGRIGVGTFNPLAALDVTATGDNSAILVPRDSTANRPSAAVNGMLRYNNSLGVMEGFIAGTWSTLSSGTGVGSVKSVASGLGLLGGPITSNGTLSVDVGSAANKIVSENANAQIAQLTGSLAAPAYTFAGDLGTGVYSPASGQVALVNAGVAALTASGGNVQLSTVTSGTWNGAAVTVPYGGTGATTLTSHGVLLGQGTGAVTATAVGGANSVLVGNAGADPTFSSTPALTSLALAGATSGAVTLAAPATVTNYTMTLPAAVASSAGQVLTSDTSGNLSWATPSATAFTGILPVANGGTGTDTTTAKFVFAGPAGANGAPSFRALAATDLPATVALTTGNSVAAAMNIGPTTSQNLNLITGNTTRMTIDTNGNTTLSTTAAGPELTISNPFNRAIVQADTFTNATTASYFQTRKGRGLSATTPTAVASNDILGAFSGKGYGGATASWTDVSYYDVGIEYRTSEAYSTTNHGSKMNFWTTPIGGTAKALRMTLTDQGFLGINNTVPTAVLTVNANSVNGAGSAGQFAAGTPNISNQAGYFVVSPAHTTNLNLNEIGLLLQDYAAIAGGTSNTGSETASFVQSFRNGIGLDDAGTLSNQFGQQIAWGHGNVSAISPTTSLSTGLLLQPSVQSGTVGTMYDLRIAPANTSGGTIGQHYAIYSDTPASSAFVGNVGIGSAGFAATALQVTGVISPGADNTYDLGTSGLRFRNIYAANSVINTSDERQKREIASSDLGLDFVTKLRPVSYRWKFGDDGDRHYGLIAQETERVIADADAIDAGIVAYDKETDRYGIRYTELIAPIIKAVQEIYVMITGLRGELGDVKTENARLKAGQDQLQRENAELKARLERLERMIEAR